VKSAVLIVNWNSGKRLKHCLESLPETPATVVVDNASTDGSLQLARNSQIAATYIENRSNRGLAAAINQGFVETSTPYVLLLNPDTRASSGAIEILEKVLDASLRAGAVGGYVNEKYLPRPIATPWTIIRENCGFPMSAINPTGELEVGQVAAAAMLVRREAYDEVGGFDDRFFPAWYEDVDFCRRLQAARWEVHFAPQAQFLHEGGYSAEALGPVDFATAYYRNQLRYVNKHFGAGAAPVRLSIVAGMAARRILTPSRAAGCSKVIAGALWEW
jgi:N-acetylglucosaminyl-diphospho-decaprenol L-rhamnosyltransferase